MVLIPNQSYRYDLFKSYLNASPSAETGKDLRTPYHSSMYETAFLIM